MTTSAAPGTSVLGGAAGGSGSTPAGGSTPPGGTPPAGGGGSTTPPAWLAGLADDVTIERAGNPVPLKGETALHGFADVGSLAKGYLEKAQAAEGAVRVPGKDAKAEEVAAFRKALGVPEKPEGYGLKVPERLPRGFVLTDEALGTFATWAHERHLPPQVAQDLVAYNVQQHEAALAKLDQAKKACDTALTQELGADGYQAALGHLSRVWQLIPDPAVRAQVVDFFDLSGAGSLPDVVKALATLGAELGEAKAPEGDGAKPKDEQDALKARYPTMFKDGAGAAA